MAVDVDTPEYVENCPVAYLKEFDAIKLVDMSFFI